PAAEVPRRCQVRIEHERAVDEGSTVVEVTDDIGEREPGCGERHRILFAHFHRPSSQPCSFRDLFYAVSRPSIRFAAPNTPRGMAMRRGKITVEFNCPVEQSQCLVTGLPGYPMKDR